jgi:hypothetical protein
MNTDEADKNGDKKIIKKYPVFICGKTVVSQLQI